MLLCPTSPRWRWKKLSGTFSKWLEEARAKIGRKEKFPGMMGAQKCRTLQASSFTQHSAAPRKHLENMKEPPNPEPFFRESLGSEVIYSLRNFSRNTKYFQNPKWMKKYFLWRTRGYEGLIIKTFLFTLCDASPHSEAEYHWRNQGWWSHRLEWSHLKTQTQ